jgi:hypothetical protein
MSPHQNSHDPLIQKWKSHSADPVIGVLISKYQEKISRMEAGENLTAEKYSSLQDEVSAIALQIESDIRSKKELKKSAWTTTFQVVLTACSTLATLLGALQINKSVQLNLAASRPLFTITANIDPSGTIGGLPPTQIDVPLNFPLPLNLRSTLPRVVVEFKNVGSTPATNFKSKVYLVKDRGARSLVQRGGEMSTANPLAKDQVFSWVDDELLVDPDFTQSLVVIAIQYHDPVSEKKYDQISFYTVANIQSRLRLFHATIEQADRALQLLKATHREKNLISAR